MSRKPSVSLPSVQKFVNAKYPDAVNIRPHQEGMVSQVFAFETGGGKYILRLNVEGEGFKKDAMCSRLFGTNVPIPDVVAYGAFDARHYFCVSVFAGDKTLQDLSVDELPAFIPQVQSLHSTISQLPITGIGGFGSFNCDGEAPFENWQAFLLSTVTEEIWGPLNNAQSRQQLAIVARAKKLYRELALACPETRALYQGDFGSNNILVGNGEIAGVIDWDSAGIGDPLIDIAGTYYWSTHLECMRLQAEFAEQTLAHLPNYRQRINCYQLRIGLEEIAEGLEDGCPPEWLDWLFQRLAAVSEMASVR